MLVSETKVAGYHTVVFDALRLSSGVYVYKITVKSGKKDFSIIKKCCSSSSYILTFNVTLSENGSYGAVSYSTDIIIFVIK